MSLTLVITDAGRAALVNAANDGTAPVRVASVGVSPLQLAASRATAALPGEIKRIGTISGGAVAPEVIHLTVRDESSEVYRVRSFALYLADGTLFAAYGQTDVILEKSAAALLLLALDVTLVDVAATAVTFGDTDFFNPPATVDHAGVVELATLAEAKAGADAGRAVTPSTAKGAVRDWIGFTPANRAGDTFTGVVEVKSAVDQPPLQLLAGEVLFPAANYERRVRWERAGASTYLLGTPGVVGMYDTAGNYLWRVDLSDFKFRIGTNLAWHAGNDGAASGLDADLLDGQQGSYYADVLGRLGYTPWHVGNDGAGSGLDADLLDGRQGAEFALLAGAGFSGGISAPAVTATGAAAQLALNDRVTPNSAAHGWSLYSSGNTLRLFSLAGNTDRFTFSAGGDFNAAGVIRQAGSAVWHLGNDGAGSGLDADLLDGQQGSYYADVIGRLGYTPWHVGNDGAGSGLDADLLDGQQGSYYADVVGRLGYTPWHVGNDGSGSGLDADLLDGRNGAEFALLAGAAFGGGVSAPAVTVTGADAQIVLSDRAVPNNPTHGWTVYSSADVLRFFALSGGDDRFTFSSAGDLNAVGVIRQAGSPVWHLANDGAGSGLDADLLDGRQASEFLRTTASSFAMPGYRTHSDGFIEQWGEEPGPIVGRGNRNIDFPIAFPNRCLGIEAVAINANSVTNGGTTHIQRVSVNPAGAVLRVQNEDATINDCAGGFSWRAWGY